MLQAMLRANVLGFATWKGTNEQLAALFPGETNAAIRAMLMNRTLQRDYFPHGGIIGAGYLDVPRALYEPVAPELLTVINPQTNMIARALAGLTYINEYLLKNTNVGQLTFYMPAPNVPPGLGNNIGAMLQTITNFNVSQLRNLEAYPVSEAFLGGFLKGRLLGVDLGDAMIEAVPPGNGGDAYFRGGAQISQNANNWLKKRG
jgi:hypothetical protein